MKIVTIIVGVATAIICGALINLGIKAFYPEPVAPAYPNTSVVVPCASNDAACQAQDAAAADQQQATFNQQEQQYQDQEAVYDKNLFIIANIVGIIMFGFGFWLVFGGALSSNGGPIGIMLAGLWGIVYGYARGWGSVDDQLKFFIGLVIAVVMVGGSMWLIEHYQKRAAQ